MTEQPDTTAIRAGIFGNPAKVIYDLCDALDAARQDSSIAWAAYDDRLIEFIAMKACADASETKLVLTERLRKQAVADVVHNARRAEATEAKVQWYVGLLADMENQRDMCSDAAETAEAELTRAIVDHGLVVARAEAAEARIGELERGNKVALAGIRIEEKRAEAAEAGLAHTKTLVGHYMRHLYAAEERIAELKNNGPAGINLGRAINAELRIATVLDELGDCTWGCGNPGNEMLTPCSTCRVRAALLP